MNKIVAIHQPNFFPWLGFFDKIARSDIFILLDDVQFPKTGGVWCNRVKLLVSDEARWVTAPIDRNYSGTRLIREMEFLPDNRWRKKMLKTLDANYRKHPFVNEALDVIGALIMNEEANVAEYNVNAIKGIAHKLGVNASKFVRSSQYKTSSASNDLLCDLTLSVGGEIYLSGGGADGYQCGSVFDRREVILAYQDFEHPIYPQLGRSDFIGGLSVIDAVMNIGWDALRDLLSNGIEK